MNKWFCDNDKKFIKKNFESILQVPELIGEENSFVLKVEDMVRKDIWRFYLQKQRSSRYLGFTTKST
ncbi:uncharacterized protein OCT59_002794 [Rhizophagus irregularis]|uniref:uncharacterized protein n=1 Tax=Rhizophagus irregularis TaxID=588596 RepID=UPI000CB54B9C|nr:hypothetical protein OCT59_002794 [Rhizophagus irregularis]